MPLRLAGSCLFGLFLALQCLSTSSVVGAGFGIFEQGSRAMGMANAFTAQADDPSAIFFNAAGLGFMHDREFAAGVSLITLGSSEFQELAPGIGGGEQVRDLATPLHLYYVEPLTDRVTFGLGINSPFGLASEWKNPETFPGRHISQRAELRTFDINPTLAFSVSDRFALAVGLIYRVSDLELQRRLHPGELNLPINEDAASVRMESDLDGGLGFNIGLLHHATDAFSWGFSYRGKITVDYGGTARFTQIPTSSPTVDAQVAGLRPFDQELPITTSVEFPYMASLGLAYKITPNVVVEADINRTGWSSFDTTEIAFANPLAPDSTIVSNWDDVNNYRFGARWNCTCGGQWRVGFYSDESPQPEESVGPLLPDADRNGYSVGWGRELGPVGLDLALMYVDFKSRTTATHPALQGSYRTDAWLLGATLGFGPGGR